MIRGTTPSLTFILPFNTAQIQSAEISVKYVDEFKKVLITKTLEDCEIGEKSLMVRLTQEETLQFPESTDAKVQLRVLTTEETALASQIFIVSVKKLLNEGVIE